MFLLVRHVTSEPEITTMGEKGQVVIPKGIREQLGVEPRTKFVVYGEGDLIVLKKLDLPDLRKEWSRIFRHADARRTKLRDAEVAREVRATRRARR